MTDDRGQKAEDRRQTEKERRSENVKREVGMRKSDTNGIWLMRIELIRPFN